MNSSDHDHDFHNTIDISSSDDDDDHDEKIYYDDDDCNADDDDSDEYNMLMDSDNSITEKSYVIIKQDELAKRQQEEINKVTSVLSISNDDACMLLLKYNWSATNVNESWFEDEVKVRESVGLLDVDHHDVKFPKNDESEVDCGICFDSVMVEDSANCGCGHVFCKVCWEGYVSTAISDGPGCLTIKCPEPSCGAAVGPDMVNVLAVGEEKKKYDGFWLRSYVESNKKIKWCPGPGCDYAVEFDDDNYDADHYDVTCDCTYVFCWKCMQDDAHSPLDCETVGKWVLKNTDESENTNWILVYTKPCPKCNRAIEKNHGCMMMTCRPPCGHGFCWLCLEPTHYGRSCNSYKKKIEHQRKSATEAIKMYTHYYERWTANEKSRKQALLELHNIKTVHLKTLSLTYCQSEKQLQFIIDAWLQIVECRRVLKWTYAYGYYIPKQEEAKKLFFEYVQGRAEARLEQLHFSAEKELQTYIRKGHDKVSMKNFSSFRMKLANLTKVTRSYFEKLVRALENGLSEVDPHEVVNKTNLGSVQGGATSSSNKVKRQKRSLHSGEPSNRLVRSVRSRRLRHTMN